MDISTLALIVVAASLISCAVTAILVKSILTKQQEKLLFALQNANDKLRFELNHLLSQTKQELSSYTQESISTLGRSLIGSQQALSQIQDKRLEELNQQFTLRGQNLEHTVSEQMKRIENRVESFSQQSEQRLEGMRTTVEKRLVALQEDNSNKLDQMRQTVDEKLQKTLNDRLTQSFTLVTQQLEQVHKGLGEMQNLASGVGDLKKVLSNVKTRGTLGEIQLGAILEQILTQDQYKTNVVTRPNTRNPVEFAVVLPGDGQNSVFLPIDSKFPMDTYSKLLDAYDIGNPDLVTAAYKELEKTIKTEAKSIREKYIEPPFTTDFAIMFLPIEGLYAEVVRRGLVELLQREYKINIAGPTTMAALLNSLQMGFRTLAIQKRSSEVWQVLSGVKSEFAKFGTVLESAQSRIKKANEDLDALIGTRTRAIVRKLSTVELLEENISEEPALLIESEQ